MIHTNKQTIYMIAVVFLTVSPLSLFTHSVFGEVGAPEAKRGEETEKRDKKYKEGEEAVIKYEKGLEGKRAAELRENANKFSKINSDAAKRTADTTQHLDLKKLSNTKPPISFTKPHEEVEGVKNPFSTTTNTTKPSKILGKRLGSSENSSFNLDKFLKANKDVDNQYFELLELAQAGMNFTRRKMVKDALNETIVTAVKGVEGPLFDVNDVHATKAFVEGSIERIKALITDHSNKNVEDLLFGWSRVQHIIREKGPEEGEKELLALLNDNSEKKYTEEDVQKFLCDCIGVSKACKIGHGRKSA